MVPFETNGVVFVGLLIRGCGFLLWSIWLLLWFVGLVFVVDLDLDVGDDEVSPMSRVA